MAVSRSGRTIPIVAPADGQAFAEIAAGNDQDIDLAVKAARRAVEEGAWGRMTATERGRLLSRLANLIESHSEELAKLEATDAGLDQVTVDIDGVTVLRNVSFAVPPGGRMALIGRNGAGKTTTVRALMGLLPLRRGTVTIEGPDCRAARGVGYAPEERRLFGSFTVRDNILLPAQVLRLPRAEVSRRLTTLFALLPERPGCRTARERWSRWDARSWWERARYCSTNRSKVSPQRWPLVMRKRSRLKAGLPNVAILITESSPDLLEPLVDATYVIERGEIVAA